jgi:hypothetical protein
MLALFFFFVLWSLYFYSAFRFDLFLCTSLFSFLFHGPYIFVSRLILICSITLALFFFVPRSLHFYSVFRFDLFRRASFVAIFVSRFPYFCSAFRFDLFLHVSLVPFFCSMVPIFLFHI